MLGRQGGRLDLNALERGDNLAQPGLVERNQDSCHVSALVSYLSQAIDRVLERYPVVPLKSMVNEARRIMRFGGEVPIVNQEGPILQPHKEASLSKDIQGVLGLLDANLRTNG